MSGNEGMPRKATHKRKSKESKANSLANLRKGADKDQLDKTHTPEAEAKRKETTAFNKAVKGEVYNCIRQTLINPDAEGHNFYQDFIKNYMEEARNNPNSKAAHYIAESIIGSNILDALDHSTDKLLSRDTDFMRYRIYRTCFGWQKSCLDTPINTHSKEIYCFGRRAGKSVFLSKLFVHSAVDKDTPMLYIHKKFTNAIQNLFDYVIKESENIGLPIKRSSKAEGYIEWENGSSLRFGGNSDVTSADNYRGFKYKVVAVDEAAFQRNLSYLINDIITPAQADYPYTRLLLVSSPPRVPKTYFELAWNERNIFGTYTWTHYSGNMLTNPYIPDPEGTIDQICKDKCLDRSSPLIAREYLGEWVFDTEAQVFKNYSFYNDIPTINRIVIGIDYGVRDYTAIATVALCNDGKKYVIKEQKFNNIQASTVISQILDTYKEMLNICNNITLVGDSSDKLISNELYRSYNLPIYDAYKVDKQFAIKQMADELRMGNLLIKKDGILQDEFEQILYKRGDDDTIIPEIDDDIYHPDLMDAVLYALRQIWYIEGKKGGAISKDQKEDVEWL